MTTVASGHLLSRVARIATTPVAVVVAVVLVAAPAGADPARPTNFSSHVLTIDPALDGASIEVQGGDAFLALAVEPGHTVVVPDYAAGPAVRPYLEFLADGTVRMNRHSAAASANESRYGSSDDEFDPDRAPSWRTVATDGTYAWHDHRIHLMMPEHLAVVDDSGRVDLGGPDGTWEVPLVVDGVDTTVRGELRQQAAPSPWPWYAVVALLALALVVGVGLLGKLPARLIGAVLSIAALAATVVSGIELGRAPEGSGASAVPPIVAAVALVGAVVALVAPRFGRSGVGAARAGTAAAAAVLLWWAIGRVDVFDHAILPSELGAFDRITTAVSLGVSLAAAGLLVWRPQRWNPPG